MAHTAHVSKTALPGVGTRYDLETDAGPHLSVVVHQDGRRILAFHDPEDDDNCKDAAPPRTPRGNHAGQAAHPRPRRPPASAHRDRPGHRTYPRHQAVAVRGLHARRHPGAFPHRGVHRRRPAPHRRRPVTHPDFRFAIGDTLVVVGTREGADAVAELITGG